MWRRAIAVFASAHGSLVVPFSEKSHSGSPTQFSAFSPPSIRNCSKWAKTWLRCHVSGPRQACVFLLECDTSQRLPCQSFVRSCCNQHARCFWSSTDCRLQGLASEKFRKNQSPPSVDIWLFLPRTDLS